MKPVLPPHPRRLDHGPPQMRLRGHVQLARVRLSSRHAIHRGLQHELVSRVTQLRPPAEVPGQLPAARDSSSFALGMTPGVSPRAKRGASCPQQIRLDIA